MTCPTERQINQALALTRQELGYVELDEYSYNEIGEPRDAGHPQLRGTGCDAVKFGTLLHQNLEKIMRESDAKQG